MGDGSRASIGRLLQRVPIWRVAVLLSLLINAGFLLCIVLQWHVIRPAIVRIGRPYLYPMSVLFASRLDSTALLVAENGSTSGSETIDFVREYVHRNSIHKIDEEHDAYASNTPRVVSMLFRFHQTGLDPPRLSCGPRAMAMKMILKELTIRSRLVHIFSDEHQFVSNHTLLDVFNSETRNWEAQDPDFNVLYVNATTKDRLSVTDLVFGDMGAVVPTSSDTVGWEGNGLFPIQDHFEALMFDERREGGDTVVLVNLDRFDLARTFTGEGGRAFEQVARSRYGMMPIVSMQGID